MRIPSRVLVSLPMLLALLLLASCSGAPGCPQTGFGSSSACSPGGTGTFGNGGGGGGGGGGGATPAAFVYAADQIGGANGTGANGTIDGYDLSTSAGTFVALSNYTAPQVPANAPGVAMVVVNKQYLYAIFQITQQIYGYSISPSNGALTALNGFPLTQAFDITNASYNQYNVTTDPGGNFLFVSATNAFPAGIYVYSINSSTGALTQVTGSPFQTPTNFAPGNLTTDGLGKYLYVCESFGDHNGGDILAYSINSSTGFLTALNGSPFSFSTIPGMWELQGDASGRYLIGTSGETAAILGSDDLHLYVFSIQQTGSNAGAITQASGSPITTTYSPFTIAMQPPSSNGEFVYSFSITDTANGYNPIEGFSLDPNTGVLTELSNSPFNNLANGPWGQFDQSGSNLVVYNDNNTDSIDELLYIQGSQAQVIPLAVDSSGNLTQPISAATLVTEGWWTITDP